MRRIMYKRHGGIDCEISDKVLIWRYMDFTKYVDVLAKKSIYFARLDKLGDPFEGSYTKQNYDRFEEMADIELSEMVDSSQEAKDARHRIIKNILPWNYRYNSKITYVNCWHRNVGESSAMWRLYLKSGEGIAIRSTTRRLVDCFTDVGDDVFIADVKYIDYEKEAVENARGVFNTFNPLIHKRASFEYEHEIRAIVRRTDQLDLREGETTINLERETLPGLSTPVSLSTLIESVYVSPLAEDWLYDLVRHITLKFNISVDVHRSSLASSPIT